MSLGIPDQILYIHNTELEKPRSTSKKAAEGVMLTSTRIVFSTEWSNQNILKVMPVPDVEVVSLQKTKDFIAPCAMYAARLSNPDIPTDDSDDPAEVEPRDQGVFTGKNTKYISVKS